MHQYHIYGPIENKGSVMYIFNMAAIFAQQCMWITCNVVSEICVQCSEHMVDAGGFICGTYMHAHCSYMPMKDMVYM